MVPECHFALLRNVLKSNPARPRDLPYFRVPMIQSLLNRPIEKLPPEAANSVTLMLPEGDAHQRTSALRRFAERLVHYKQRRIWPGVTNVRRSSELETASRLRIPFVTGPAVCAPVPAPVGGRAVALTNLPLSLRETWVPRPQIA